MLKNQKGITLVALVITIIVLLILAGVSISLVIGNNGILNQASTAAVKTTDADAKQAIQLATLTAETEYLVTRVDNPSYSRETAFANAKIKANLQDLGYSEVDVSGTNAITGLDITLTPGGTKYTLKVDANGNVTIN